ncbi:SDR family oxidoreductase [Mycolicibacterium sp. XJ1819]
MKITVFGATGLIGSQVAPRLTAAGHTVVAAVRDTGVDVLTGEGLAEALSGADVLIDLTNSPSFADDAVLEFFTTSTTNLVKAATAAGVGHYVALSIVGADALPQSGYMRAKVAQESIIGDSGLPYTVVRATQFHEFAESITESLTVDGEVRAPDGLIQPIAAEEVAAAVAQAAQEPARNGHIDIGGPDKISFADLATTVLRAKGEDRPVVVTSDATYFGTPVDDSSLVTGGDATIASIRFTDWLARR